jgi:hypothetical protein
MTAGVFVVKNEYGRIAAEMAARARAVEEETARNIAERARATAPVGGADDPHAGRFRDGFRAEGNRVVNDDPVGRYIEFGTSDTPTFATLRNATDAERPAFLEASTKVVQP